MTLMGICGGCVEESPPGRPPERQYLKRGPDGRKLCSRHAKKAWNNQNAGTYTEERDR